MVLPAQDLPERFTLREKGARRLGEEKPHTVLKSGKTVLVARLSDPPHEAVSEAFDRIDAQSVLGPGGRVAIKVNLGGGIRGVPSSYSHPTLCEAIIRKVKDLGAEPFVCEADMRARHMDERLLKERGYADMLRRNDVEFVNLSEVPAIEMKCLGLDIPLLLPEILLDPATRIISFAPPKHHWECGITCSQKNMYGAIAEQRKSTFHRKFTRIDKVVAAAARLMCPDVSIVGAFDVGAGLGPHFCIPIPFNRIIVAKDMLRCDKVAAEILGYPFERVEYAMLNAQGQEVDYALHADSDWPDAPALERIRKHSVNERTVRLWKPLLYPQYFVPHAFQLAVYPHFEWIATWVNKLFFESRA